ncbi:signal peptidase I [Eubacteriales bacterium OttesenSCG-928-A19]|nr:signal peptidase I [Eubacteriales bacterium OttesenSCG-928-A19]
MDDLHNHAPEEEKDESAQHEASAEEAEAMEMAAEMNREAEVELEDEGASPPKKSIGREILEWILVIVVAVAAALLIRTFIFEPVRVDGNSMLNTLYDKEYMIVTKYQYLFGDPERFDVVICHYPNRGSTNFVKRVVGIPGDTVAMHNGELYVNGEAVDEPNIDYKANYEMAPVTVEEGHYFVLGDNRSNSNDSHAPGVGQLTRNQIVGEVRLVVWPFANFRTIN